MAHIMFEHGRSDEDDDSEIVVVLLTDSKTKLHTLTHTWSWGHEGEDHTETSQKSRRSEAQQLQKRRSYRPGGLSWWLLCFLDSPAVWPSAPALSEVQDQHFCRCFVSSVLSQITTSFGASLQSFLPNVQQKIFKTTLMAESNTLGLFLTFRGFRGTAP